MVIQWPQLGAERLPNSIFLFRYPEVQEDIGIAEGDESIARSHFYVHDLVRNQGGRSILGV